MSFCSRCVVLWAVKHAVTGVAAPEISADRLLFRTFDLRGCAVPLIHFLTVHTVGVTLCLKVISHGNDMINDRSCLYKSQFKHSIHHLLFSLLHPSLVSGFPWVIVQCNQHIVAVCSVSTLSDDDDCPTPRCVLVVVFVIKGSINLDVFWMNLLKEKWLYYSFFSFIRNRL